ncbi:hypothetical protein HanRHA438_Chr14g0635741 [Helianthus annuus]|uniref:Uncharacterized protein n=1 Tax=Helianthus annuus TaxID=4232 RepID=A0A9K3H670_HELAN|nr:hypothetical protein HanXRQr2_Chr14g0625761 [Helianthus annuus]KAJ0838925.1 hypothetical protein HanPSC8_Chr14g0600541 [Helianthus annuus]KAJ0852230.1 hypothetical protein HanRHA438_Chr14g0635741 [Helianthus annuus]
MTGRGKNPLFPVTKVWRLHILCPNNEVRHVLISKTTLCIWNLLKTGLRLSLISYLKMIRV